MSLTSTHDVQYWIYAALNKKFGRQLSIQRDPLHNRYDVNRHCFYVYGVNIYDLKSFMIEMMHESGYVGTDAEKIYRKTISDWNLYVSIRYTSDAKILIGIYKYRKG